MLRRAVAVSVVLLLAGCQPITTAPSTTHTAPATSTSVPAVMLNPAVTQATIGQTICKAAWTKTIRPGNLPKKKGYRLDHIVSLELGGAPRNPANLRFVLTARSLQDDKLENKLHRQVCAVTNPLPLAEAQREIVAAKAGE